MLLDLFANQMVTVAVATGLIVGQSLWWWRLLKKPAMGHFPTARWVLYASQSGQAQYLAEQTAKQLSNGQKQWHAVSLLDWQRGYELSALNEQTLLFVVSTQGEGDPPDNAVAFFHQLQMWSGDLSQLTFAVLGLGDSRYTHFCGFSHNLHQQLIQRGASALFDVVTVDNLNADDIGVWYRHLADHFELGDGLSTMQELPTSATATATLIDRHCENRASPAMSLFSLQFRLATQLTWQAGDIADVSIPANNGEILRQYSIANVVADDGADSEQTLSLLVRQISKDNGELGIGSGYLTETLNVGEGITLSIRPNPSFHLPDKPTVCIFIATGSGLAAILALLQQAESTWGTAKTHHLIYGERHFDSDTPCREQLNHYQNSGLLNRVDYCFSRGEGNYRYVQDALIAQTDVLKTTINYGAMVYVCGSKATLGESIPHTLEQCLGANAYEKLLSRNGLRLDVY